MGLRTPTKAHLRALPWELFALKSEGCGSGLAPLYNFTSATLARYKPLMPQAATNDRRANLPTVSSSLGIKGSLRVRAYGNVKHAHVVLRKVEEEEFEDSHGKMRRRAVFSVFAHKLINVKAGKELYLYLHPANGTLHEVPIAFEGEVLDEDEEVAEEQDAPPAPVLAEKKVEEAVQQQQQAMPPKMRKLWAKRNESSEQVSGHNT